MKKIVSLIVSITTLFGLGFALLPSSVATASTAITVPLPWTYTFNSPGVLNQTTSGGTSGSAYWWVEGGGQLVLSNGVGGTLQGDTTSANPWYAVYAKSLAVTSDNGKHPQNTFETLLRTPILNTDQSVSVQVSKDNLANTVNRVPWNGIHLISRWQDNSNYYFAGIRDDGHAIIKKEVNGVYYTLAEKQIFPGTWSISNPDLLPKNTWMNMRMTTNTDSSGAVHIDLYLDQTQSGTWTLLLDAVDTGTRGAIINTPGLEGIRSDYMDLSMDNYKLFAPTTVTPPPPPTPTPPAPAPTNYDSAVLADNPVMYLSLATSTSGTEKDLSGNGNNGTYKGGIPTTATLPNGDKAADFNGSGEYVTVPSSPALSIPTTHELTWEAWIRPDTLQFPNDSGYGYVDFMGKCQDYGPTCEWESRMYSTTNPEGRANRLSAYVFNPSAGLGSAADWQPNANTIQSGQWLHVVGEYQTITTPTGCSTIDPGSINIWVNGVKWDQAAHFPTGCMSQFSVTPTANNSPLNIATMAMETWFHGAIGKVAIYNYLLNQTQINTHFTAMTGSTPSGSCAQTCTIPVTP